MTQPECYARDIKKGPLRQRKGKIFCPLLRWRCRLCCILKETLHTLSYSLAAKPPVCIRTQHTLKTTFQSTRLFTNLLREVQRQKALIQIR